MPTRAGEKPLTSCSPCAKWCWVIPMLASRCVFHKDTEHRQHRDSSRLFSSTGWSTRLGRCCSCQIFLLFLKEEENPYLGIMSHKAALELWVPVVPHEEQEGQWLYQESLLQLQPSSSLSTAALKLENLALWCWGIGSILLPPAAAHSRQLPSFLALTAEIASTLWIRMESIIATLVLTFVIKAASLAWEQCLPVCANQQALTSCQAKIPFIPKQYFKICGNNILTIAFIIYDRKSFNIRVNFNLEKSIVLNNK